MTMKFLLLILVSAFTVLAQNAPGTVTNETIIRLVASGVPAATIIRTIDSSDSVAFRFLPGDLSALAQANVPDDVIKAMAARSKRVVQSAPAAAPVKVTVPSPSAQAAPPPKATPPSRQVNPRISATDEYQGRGVWDVGFQGSVSIPHASASAYVGFAEGSVGYFVARKSEVGFAASGVFIQGYKDVVLGGFYRQYLVSGEKRVIPYVGAAAGADIVHYSVSGTNGNFAAIGQGGLRMFVTKHVALDVGYNLVYVRINGLGFKDSSLSQVSVGFAHVFGK
jgi:hypothetical protein